MINTPPTSPTKKLPLPGQHQQRLQCFISLKWYEGLITFVFTFAAQTSEMLLAAGLVVSTANFLTDGKVMGSGTGLATAWAWAQALAIDSSLGVTFYYVFASVKHRDWIKVVCYGILTLLLAVVAGTITNIDTFSHAIHISIANAIIQVGLDVKILTTLRAIAVVGFVLMSRMKDVSFKEFYEASPSAEDASRRELRTPEERENTAALIRKLVAEALVEQRRSVVIEEEQTLPISMPNRVQKAHQKEQPEEPPEEREARVALAYLELVEEGKRLSGRALAARAHVRRTTCNQWLAVHHPEVIDDEPEEESEER